jgi:hypothetical protein
VSTATTPRRKPVSRVDRHHVVDLPDVGCAWSRTCRDCWLTECWYVMAPDQRQQLKDALAVIRPFVRQADRALA